MSVLDGIIAECETQGSLKITLVTRIHYQHTMNTALVNTQVALYCPELNHWWCFPLRRSVQGYILFCTYGYRPNQNISQTMPIFFREQASNMAVHWVFYNINCIHKEYNNIYFLAWKYQILPHADDSQRPHFEVEFESLHTK